MDEQNPPEEQVKLGYYEEDRHDIRMVQPCDGFRLPLPDVRDFAAVVVFLGLLVMASPPR